MNLTNDNLLVYAAKFYYNPVCIDEDEFLNDLSRIKYVKRALSKYKNSGILQERIILNHLIVLFNVFGFEFGLKVLELKIEPKYWSCLKPFLIFLKAIKNDQYTNIEMDKTIIERLRKI